jgi:hypothetical protein
VVVAVESIPRRGESEPGAKPSIKVLDRFTLPPERQVTYDADGNERGVVGRRPRGY